MIVVVGLAVVIASLVFWVAKRRQIPRAPLLTFVKQMSVAAAHSEFVGAVLEADHQAFARLGRLLRFQVVLMMVARWICQNLSGSSSSVSSLIGFLMSASAVAVKTRVYLSSAWK